MARDVNNRELRVGDHVVIHADVVSVRADDDGANVTLQTHEPGIGTDQRHRFTIFGGQVEKLDEPTGEPTPHKAKAAHKDEGKGK